MSKATPIAVQTNQSDPYEIIIGVDILSALGAHLRPLLRRNKIAIVADKNALKAWGEKLRQAIQQAELDAVIIEAPAGEEAKNFAMLEKICANLLENHIERDDIVLSFGGGAIGDLTGLASNLVRRGVRCCHIPTTLLAQTDSAIGGKTAINSAWGKNLIGTFYPPSLVLIDTTLTASLPQREFLCGYAEIVKYGIIGDEKFFTWLEENGKALVARDPEALRYGIEKSCRAKASIVSQDEKETGKRALLNFGHSFGHALESLSNYEILHGEAVSIGMVLASQFSVALGLMEQNQAQRIKQHLHSVGLPIGTKLLQDKSNREKMIGLMQQDKKAKQGALVLILARAIGDAFVYDKCSAKQLRDFLAQQELELAS
jgi:3-dehydroquinate synthase